MNDVNATISSAAGILGSLTLTGIISALLTLLGCLLAKKILLRLLSKGFSRTRLDARLTRFALKAVNAVLWVVILLILCDTLGINISSLLALFSVVGLAFSLALQDSLSNLASGIMLLASHPFKPGDYIEAGGQEGTVQTTGVIYTQLVTPDNKRIHVPNSAISAGKIVNYSSEPNRRVDITVSASYDDATQKVRAAILEAIGSCTGILQDPAPAVLLSDYGDSAITYTVRVWTKNADYWPVTAALREEIRESFARSGVTMTYNHLNVHLMQD